MSNRKIINAASTGGIGYYPVVGAIDPYYDKVSLLLNGDTDVDTNFANVSLLLTGNDLLDKSNNKLAVTAYGNATVTSVKKQFGTGSYYFDGTGDYLSLPTNTVFDFGNSNFTIECWYYNNGASSSSYPSLISSPTWDATGFAIRYNSTGNGVQYSQKFSLHANGTDGVLISTNTFASTVWHHIALVRSGTTIQLFVNGNIEAQNTSYSSSLTCNSGYIGGNGNGWGDGGKMCVNGYIDDLRITKGIARYTANFTPPTQALLSHEILDRSVYSLPVTTYGNARIDTATKKYGTGSMYFDGSGDYAYIPNSSATSLGTFDFTIELWYQPISKVNGFPRVICRGTAANDWITDCWYLNDRDNNSDTTKFVFGANNIAVNFLASTTSVVNGIWYHLAVTRQGSTFRMFVNGALESTYTSTASLDASTSGYIGVGGSTSGQNPNGYLDDVRITKGYARYTANFTPPTTAFPTIPPTILADPWWGNVSLLLDGNTTDAYDPYWQNVSLMLTGDDFIDWSNQHNAITNNGTVTLSTVNKKFNASSYNFSGSNYLSISYSTTLFDWWTSDFTLEFWINPTSLSSCQVTTTEGNFVSNLIGNMTPASSINYWSFGPIASGVVAMYYYIGSVVTPIKSTATISQGVWSHIALTKNSSGFQIWVNGVGNGYTAITGTPQSSTGYPLTIGKFYNGSFNGQIADLRITKGIARTITVPTTALPAFKIQDRTQNNLTLTPYGNVQLSTDVKKNGTGSMYFDGTGDYLTVPVSTSLSFGTGDFTVEAWVYRASTYNLQTFFSIGDYISGLMFRFDYFSFVGTATDLSSFIPINTWCHVAVTRSGSTLKVFINGTSIYTVTSSASHSCSAGNYIGTSTHAFTSEALTGYIDDLRITKGYARYTQNFTPPSQSFPTQYISTGFDPNYADVSLLLTGEGTNGSTTFNDLSSSPKTITNNGPVAATITTSTKKYGTGSILFAGTSTSNCSKLVVTDTGFGTADFTLEMWVNFSSSTADQYIFDSRSTYGDTAGFGLLYNDPGLSNKIGVYHGSGWLISTSVSTATNSWTHVALCRVGTTFNIFINGVSGGTATSSANLSSTIYRFGSGNDNYPLVSGYIDDIRVTKGIARYTTNFTPPTYALATTTGTAFDVNRADTSLLLRGNGTNGSTSFTDESPNNYAITVDGTAAINTTYKKYGTGSIRINGVGNGLRTTNSIGNFGTNDLTIECWAMFDAITNNGLFQLAPTNSTSPSVSGLAVGYYNNAWGVYYNGTYSATTSSTAPIANTWFHLALVRCKGQVSLFFNGIQQGTSFTDSTTDFTNTFANIGWWYGLSGGGGQMSGYIDDFRITKGYARYTANFTPPTYEDPIVTGTQYDYNYAQVSLLLNGDGTNGSTTFTDLSSSPKTITNTGSVTVNTTAKKFGTGSISFSGSNYLSIPSNSIALGTNDYTFEAWVYPVSVSGVEIIFRDSTSGGFGLVIYTSKFDVVSASVNDDVIGSTTLSINTWYHVAVCRSAGTTRLFVNGILDGSFTTARNYSSSNAFKIGGDAGSYFTGYIDDLRITNSVARYTQNFTPPTAPLPTSYS
jgi:hypothetical protein